MEALKIGVLIGSLRRESFCKKTARALRAFFPETLEYEEIEIAQLPIYNQDLDDDGYPPQSWLEFREGLKKYDAFLFVTPEYNRSTSAVLKNALDVGSRPYGKSKWNRKPAAVISVSPGAIGGFGANHSVRQSLVCLNVATMPAPELYLGNVAFLYGEDGSVIDAKTIEVFQRFVMQFEDWILKNQKS